MSVPANTSIEHDANSYDLWLAGGHVLTISIDPTGKRFQPIKEHITSLHETIELLARASKAVMAAAENHDERSPELVLQTIEGISDSIVFFSQLSRAVQEQLDAKKIATATAGKD